MSLIHENHIHFYNSYLYSLQERDPSRFQNVNQGPIDLTLDEPPAPSYRMLSSLAGLQAFYSELNFEEKAHLIKTFEIITLTLFDWFNKPTAQTLGFIKESLKPNALPPIFSLKCSEIISLLNLLFAKLEGITPKNSALTETALFFTFVSFFKITKSNIHFFTETSKTLNPAFLDLTLKAADYTDSSLPQIKMTGMSPKGDYIIFSYIEMMKSFLRYFYSDVGRFIEEQTSCKYLKNRDIVAFLFNSEKSKTANKVSLYFVRFTFDNSGFIKSIKKEPNNYFKIGNKYTFITGAQKISEFQNLAFSLKEKTLSSLSIEILVLFSRNLALATHSSNLCQTTYFESFAKNTGLSTDQTIDYLLTHYPHSTSALWTISEKIEKYTGLSHIKSTKQNNEAMQRKRQREESAVPKASSPPKRQQVLPPSVSSSTIIAPPVIAPPVIAPPAPQVIVINEDDIDIASEFNTIYDLHFKIEDLKFHNKKDLLEALCIKYKLVKKIDEYVKKSDVLKTKSPSSELNLECLKAFTLISDYQFLLNQFNSKIKANIKEAEPQIETETVLDLPLEVFVDDPTLQPISVALPQAARSIFRGLPNVGNSCYLNAAMQVLLQIPELKLILNQEAWPHDFINYFESEAQFLARVHSIALENIHNFLTIWQNSPLEDFSNPHFFEKSFENSPIALINEQKQGLKELFERAFNEKKLEFAVKQLIKEYDFPTEKIALKQACINLRKAFFDSRIFIAGDELTSMQDPVQIWEKLFQTLKISNSLIKKKYIPENHLQIGQTERQPLSVMQIELPEANSSVKPSLQDVFDNAFSLRRCYDIEPLRIEDVGGTVIYESNEWDEEYSLESPQKFLIIQLKRYLRSDTGELNKIDTSYEVPENYILDLSKAFLAEKGSYLYLVKAVIHHDDFGLKSPTTGHYKALIITDHLHLLANDKRADTLTEPSDIISSGYLYVLERVM